MSMITIWSGDSISSAFTANTPKLIPVTGFSQSINVSSDFSFNATTGVITYNGVTTRPYRVTILYSYQALALAATLTNFISKNSSLIIGGVRTVISFILLGQTNILNSFLTDVMILSMGDTIQLGGQFSTTNSVNFQAVSISINQS